MKATMMLADSAQVADGKLYVLGGGWSVIGTEPVPTALAIKVEIGWHETDRNFHWELFLEDADGAPVLFEGPEGSDPIEIRGEMSSSRPEGVLEGVPVDVPMAINLGPLPLLPASRYIWRMIVDGEAIEGGSIAFSTRPALA